MTILNRRLVTLRHHPDAGTEHKHLLDAVGDLNAAALRRHVRPSFVEISVGLRRETVSHQREDERSDLSRRRPRCFTSSASAFIDSCVIGRVAASEGLFRLVERCQDLRASAFTFFPEGQRFLNRLFLAMEPAAFDDHS